MPATQLTGIVTKAGAMAKTVTMTVEKVKMHPKLLKTYVRHKKYLVHDEHSELQIGERIRAQACRPLSARKRFTLLERLGFKDMPTTHDEHGTPADERRRQKADAAMSAEQRERLRIEQRVKEEMRARS
ncbi:hypothetical protein GLX27_001098 [Malassezia furfur]|uniref:30S ribosomal protein S17 n=1 Tax=Malassezia furfur TaxID=55194 RepID=A0ABY8ELN2_MALFU|nr:hypothetical protein GLX27_001098 [Malassezia furfur]